MNATTTEATTTLTWRKIFNLGDTITEGATAFMTSVTRHARQTVDESIIRELSTACRMQFSTEVLREFPAVSVNLAGDVIGVPVDEAADILKEIAEHANTAFMDALHELQASWAQ